MLLHWLIHPRLKPWYSVFDRIEKYHEAVSPSFADALSQKNQNIEEEDKNFILMQYSIGKAQAEGNLLETLGAAKDLGETAIAYKPYFVDHILRLDNPEEQVEKLAEKTMQEEAGTSEPLF